MTNRERITFFGMAALLEGEVSDVVEELTMIKQRVAYLEDENARLRRRRRDKVEETRSGRNIWVGSDHKSLQVSHELLGAALPDAVRGFPVALFAKYEDNVNTAVKGAAIAAERLKAQGRNVAVEASFRLNRNELTLLVIDVTVPIIGEPPAALTVASQTGYKTLGGAVANRVRDARPTLLRAIGKRAVWAATRAVAVAREYVLDTGIDLLFAPRFTSVQLTNRTEPSTVVELLVFVKPPPPLPPH